MATHRRTIGLIIATIGLLFGPETPSLALDSFGGSCASQGEWTRLALDQAKEIESAVTALQSDPNCKGIESILGKVRDSARIFGLPAGAEGLQAGRLESIPGEVNALRSYLQNGGGLSDTV